MSWHNFHLAWATISGHFEVVVGHDHLTEASSKLMTVAKKTDYLYVHQAATSFPYIINFQIHTQI